MAENLGYSVSEIELNETKYIRDKYNVWTIDKHKRDVKEYNYDDAINLTGHGRYNIGLLVTTSFALIGMALDMFGFISVVQGCACEFHLQFTQHKILVSIPFFGAMFTSYAWGYISDTQGRKKSLLIAMWGSFLATVMGAFSPHWIALGFFKFVSVCFCAHSATYAMIGESCPESVKGPYMFILTSVLNLGLPYYMVISYFTVRMDFSYNFGFIYFTSWRLLALTLALPLGISAVSLHFFYESPKFLANIRLEDQALENLRKIWRRNHGGQEKYPVEKFTMIDNGSIRPDNITLLQSMWKQTVPLFKMPLLLQSLKLYYLTLVVYGVTNSMFTWFTLLSSAFTEENSSLSNETHVQGLCNIINKAGNTNNAAAGLSCKSKTSLAAVWSSVIQGLVFIFINISVCKLANRRKALLIIILTISSFSAFVITFIPNNVASLILYFAICLTIIGTGIICSYFVDLYPTSYRGMAACLSVLVARVGGVIATYLVGTYVNSHCANTFYAVGVYIFSGIVVACLLPPDKQTKTLTTDTGDINPPIRL